ncbi:MAG: quinone-dependent dihydroorotate dehydrogenase [Alistipes sp.]|nr:quinone-dependent dihydroorotate dehydrogenase [Alistipes sp.]
MKLSPIRKILSVVNPETAHNIALRRLRAIGAVPAGKWFLGKRYAERSPMLEREVFGMKFPNPVGVAAGYDCNGEAIEELAAAGFGFVEIGTVTPRPQAGNPRPRLFRMPSAGAMLDRTGYPSKGLEYVMGRVRNRRRGIIVGCNIGKNTITPDHAATGDYLKVFRNMYQYVDYFSINVCCNTSSKVYVPTSKDAISELLAPLFEFRRGQSDYRPILIKISPDLSTEQLDQVVDALVELPLDGIVAVAGTLSRDGLTSAERAYADSKGAGAISGAPLTRRAIETVAYIHRRSGGFYPIIGSGGMMSPEDVRDMLAAGASLVQLNTGIIYHGIGLAGKICRWLTAAAKAEQSAAAGNKASGTAAESEQPSQKERS